MRKAFVFTLALILAFTGAGPVFVQAESNELFFTILHTNDEHAALAPSPLVDYKSGADNPALGGFARLAQAVEEVRAAKDAASEPVLLVSGGDFMGGSPYSWLTLDGKAAELTLMQELGYDVVTIGNHEYDYGPDILAKYLQAAGYPESNAKTVLLAANTLPPSGHALNDVGLRKNHIIELSNGLKVGFFGLIGIDAVNVAPYSAPVEFADQAETAAAAVAELEQLGADVIVAVTHAGEDEDVDLVKAVPGIDVIIGGHAHTLLEQPIIEGETIIAQSGELLQHLGNLELAYSPSTGKVRLRNAEDSKPYVIPIDSKIEENPRIAALMDVYTADLNALISEMTGGRFNDITETVVWSDFVVRNQPELEETPFGNFVTDAMRLVAGDVTGDRVDLAFQANGVLRGSIEPGSMPWSQGQVAFFDLADLVGLGSGPDGTPGYPMVSVYFTGEELHRIFEVQVLLAELMGDTYFLQISGGRMSYDPNRAVLFTVPFLDLPIPTTMAVLEGELYTGEGVQGGDEFARIKKDDTLYHVVTDYYIAAFLPMAGEMLPSLELVMKDKEGNPVSVDEAIIYRDGRELKVWQAVLEYAAAQPLDSDGNPRIQEYYTTTSGRLMEVKTFPPLWVWLVLILLAVITLIVFAVRAIRRRRRQTRTVNS